MNKHYDTIQGLLSYVLLFSFAIGFAFTFEYYTRLTTMDLTPWGYTYLPTIFGVAWGIFAVALIAKVWGAWVEYGFFYRVTLSNKLRATADRVDPRRR